MKIAMTARLTGMRTHVNASATKLHEQQNVQIQHPTSTEQHVNAIALMTQHLVAELHQTGIPTLANAGARTRVTTAYQNTHGTQALANANVLTELKMKTSVTSQLQTGTKIAANVPAIGMHVLLIAQPSQQHLTSALKAANASATTRR